MMEPLIAVYSDNDDHIHVEIKGASAIMVRSVAAHLIMADIDAQHESEIGRVTGLGAFFLTVMTMMKFERSAQIHIVETMLRCLKEVR